jgi:2-polyprenyl-6-hydroxyphenyl methylase/3-demethylubiquinone-9 3-methyltransferase
MDKESQQAFPLVRFLNNRTYAEAVEIFEQRIHDATEVYKRFSGGFFTRACPVCGHAQHRSLEAFHDTYGVVACSACQSQFVNPTPSLEALSYYYNHCKCNLMLGELYRKRAADKGNFVISERSQYIISLLKNLPTDRTLEVLEIGCSSGGFLANLKAGLAQQLPTHKVRLSGIDIDANAIEKSVDPSLHLVASPVEKYVQSIDRKFDLVVHFELIEHLGDPFEFMRCVHRLLRPGALHVFHTPNALGMETVASPYNSLRLIAHAIFPPMHLNAFSTQNIVHFALRSGFAIESIDTPGKLDVDMTLLCKDQISPTSPYAHLAQMNDSDLGLLQAIVTDLRASSHMRCTLRKN